MAQYSYAEALALVQNDPIKALALLIAGIGPDGKTAGPSGGGVGVGGGGPIKINDEDGTPVVISREVGGASMPSLMVDASGNPTGVNDNLFQTVNQRASDSSTDNFAVGTAATGTNGPDTLFDASVTNAAEELKATPGQLYGYHLVNNHADTAVWIQVFNVAAASVVLGTTPPKKSLKIPGGGVLDMPQQALGVPFGTAMSYACTATATGAGAPASAATVNFDFK